MVIGTGVGECLAVVELLSELGDVTVSGDPDQVGLTFYTGDLPVPVSPAYRTMCDDTREDEKVLIDA